MVDRQPYNISIPLKKIILSKLNSGFLIEFLVTCSKKKCHYAYLANVLNLSLTLSLSKHATLKKLVLAASLISYIYMNEYFTNLLQLCQYIELLRPACLGSGEGSCVCFQIA